MTQELGGRLKKTHTDTLKEKNKRKQNTTKLYNYLTRIRRKIFCLMVDDNFRAIKIVTGSTLTVT
jgi:hypothetical protein